MDFPLPGGLRLKDCRFGGRTRLNVDAPTSLYRAKFGGHSIKIGAYTYATDVYISAGSVGRFCSIAVGLNMGGAQHPTNFLSTHPFQYKAADFEFYKDYRDFQTDTAFDGVKAPPKVGHDVWIGTNVTILRGVTVGNGAILAAGAVVISDVEPYSIVGGVPAKHIRYRFDSAEIRQRLLELEWWNYTLKSLQGVPFDNVAMALDVVERRKSDGELKVLVPPRYRIEDGQVIPLNPQAKNAMTLRGLSSSDASMKLDASEAWQPPIMSEEDVSSAIAENAPPARRPAGRGGDWSH